MSGKQARRKRRPFACPAEGASKGEWALSYGRQGIPVFPVTSTGAPLVGALWQRTGSLDAAQIARWWREWPNASIAMPTGAASGMMAVETHDPIAYRAAQELLPGTGMELVGARIGQRIFVYHVPGHPSTMPTQRFNDPLPAPGKSAALITLHGDGDYILLPTT